MRTLFLVTALTLVSKFASANRGYSDDVEVIYGSAFILLLVLLYAGKLMKLAFKMVRSGFSLLKGKVELLLTRFLNHYQVIR